MVAYKNGEWRATDAESVARREQEEAERARWLNRIKEQDAEKAARNYERRNRIHQQDVEFWAQRDNGRRTDGAATATLVLGILSFFLIPLALISFITSAGATRNGSRTAGLVCSWVSIVLYGAGVAYIVSANAISNSPYN